MADVLRANEQNFLMEIDGVGSPLYVLRFTGKEAISETFYFSVRVQCSATDLNPADIIGKNALFTIHSAGYFRTFKAIVYRFQFSGLERDVAIYDVRLVSELMVLAARQDCRIFQEKTVTTIIQDVLTEAGMSAERYNVSCTGSYPTEEFCVQYRESDLNFVDRLAETCGIFYFVDFTDDSKLVFGDAPSVHPEIPDSSVPFHVAGGKLALTDFLYEVVIGQSLRTNKHTLRDYNYESPGLDLTKSHSGTADTDLESYDYPGKFSTQDVGAALAEVRSQTDDRLRATCRGRSNSIRLSPGFKFTLTDHPINSVNNAYLITAVTHEGSQPSPESAVHGELGYSNSLVFQGASVPCRPVRQAAKPRIDGAQTATVSGPDGHEIYSDKFGRVKVRFHWDRGDAPAERSSCWVRVAQSSAGKAWGAMFIPRIGQEVLVSFLEGDPDRPIITGSVYNGANVTPYDLPGDQTISTIKSNSSMGGGGFNEIRFEDKKDSEQVYLHAQKNFDLETLNNKTESVGNNESLSVAKDRSRSVGGNESVSITKNRSHSVGKDESISVAANQTASVGKNQTVSVGKSQTVDVGENHSVTIAKEDSESIGASKKVQIDKDYLVSIGKKYGCTAADSVVVNSDKEITLKCGSASIVMKKNGDITIKGKNINIKGSGNIVMKGSKITQN